MSDTRHQTTITEHKVTDWHDRRITYFIVDCVCGYQSGALWSRQEATRDEQDHRDAAAPARKMP